MDDKAKQIMQERLKEVFKGETQTKIAERLNTSQTGISKILKGSQSLTLETAYAISKEYNVSVDWLLGLSDVKEPTNLLNDITYYQAVDALLRMDDHGSFDYGSGKITLRDPILRFLFDEASNFHHNSRKYIHNWKHDELNKFRTKRMLFSVAFEDKDFWYLASELRNVDDAVKLYYEGLESEEIIEKTMKEASPYDMPSEENDKENDKQSNLRRG